MNRSQLALKVAVLTLVALTVATIFAALAHLLA